MSVVIASKLENCLSAYTIPKYSRYSVNVIYVTMIMVELNYNSGLLILTSDSFQTDKRKKMFRLEWDGLK